MDDTRLVRLEDKLDGLGEIQSQMRADLQEHMRRTDIAEKNIDLIADKIQPIQEHVAFVRGMGKLLGILAAIGSTAVAILQYFLTTK